ncbi:MAG: hypothetical protein ACLSVD_01225 [Eggerthellaceae bacterium]
MRCFLYESADGEVKSEEAIARAEAEALAGAKRREVETAEALLAAEDLREAEIEEIEKEGGEPMSENTASNATASAQGARSSRTSCSASSTSRSVSPQTRTSSARRPPTQAVDDVSFQIRKERRSAWWANRAAANHRRQDAGEPAEAHVGQNRLRRQRADGDEAGRAQAVPKTSS